MKDRVRGEADRRRAAPPTTRHRPTVRAACLLALLLAAGCAAGRGGPGPDGEPGPGAPPGPAPAPDRGGAAALDRVRSLLAAEPGRALHLADSLYFAIRGRPAGDIAPRALRLQARAAAAAGDTAGAAVRLRELLAAFPDADAADGAAPELARLLRARADDPAALAVLLRHGGGEETLDLMRRAAGHMSAAELERAASAPPGTAPAARALVLAELAEARALAGRPEAAREAARGALEAGPEEPDRRTARSVLDGAVRPATEPVRVGVLLPDSGRFARVGRWVRRGMRIALEAAGEGPAVETVARDLSAGPPGRLLAGLAEEGVVAVVGPLRTEGLVEAAGARPDPGLLLVSPTAGRSPDGPLDAYALRGRVRRELDAAAALGRWVGAGVRPGPSGAVYPEGELGRRAYLRFRRALGDSGGGWIVASASYDPGATTLQGPVTEVSAFRPDAVYAGASGTSSLLQMAPQLAYYGIRAALVVGGPDWTRPGAVRRLDPVFSQFRVGAAFAREEGEGETARARFRAAYETRYRSTLGDNVLPMLGHDAALLVRRALAAARPARPRAVARAFAGLSGVEGATGLLDPVRGDGTVRRRIALRALEDRRLRPTGAEEVRAWLASAGRLQAAGARGRRARALRAVREADIPLEPSRSEAAEGGEEPR